MNDNDSLMQPRRLGRWFIAALTGSCWLLVLSVCNLNAAPQIQLLPIVSGLDRPVAITHAGDDSGRLFITLQAGTILIVDEQGVLDTPFLDIGPLVTSGGERGLLSVAFHPDYAANGRLYVNYTDLEGATVVAGYQVSTDPNVVEAASATILITIPQPFSNHNGGQLQFGPDGYLYIGMGDGGSGGDPENHAQNLGSLLGKMLRIDVDTGPPYGIPPDNPFIGHPNARPEIWALGLRNPWRFSFDRLTGDLWIADVGQNRFEEVNFQTAESTGGENYGWRLMEGDRCFNPAADCDDGSLTLPVLQYDHSQGCSISGGYRYRGEREPDLAGFYFYGDFCTGRIWGASRQADGNWSTAEALETALQITAFGEDQAGEIYVVDYRADAGAIYRIVQVAPASQPGASNAGGCFISTVTYAEPLTAGD